MMPTATLTRKLYRVEWRYESWSPKALSRTSYFFDRTWADVFIAEKKKAKTTRAKGAVRCRLFVCDASPWREIR